MDSAGYTAETLMQTMRWLMRVPETMAQAKQQVKEATEAEMLEFAAGYQGKEVVCG